MVKFPPKIIYAISCLLSPFVFIIFSLPSKILKKFKATEGFANKIPFNFGTSFFSLRGDLYDRFAVPIEHRFNRQEVYDMFAKCGFFKITITKLNDIAGWVGWGYKR